MFDNIEVLYDEHRELLRRRYHASSCNLPSTTPATSSETMSITTTLYDLVAALNAEVDAEDDALVTAAVVHLINTNRARFIGSRKRLAIVDA